MKIYFDMDDVLVGLSAYMIKRANETFHTTIDWEKLDNQNFRVLEGEIIPNGWFQNELNKKGAFKFPKPIQNSVELFQLAYTNLTSQGNEVYIATTPQFNDWCCREKINWIKQYMPFFPVENIIFIQNKSLLANDQSLLIDDYCKNINKFMSKGGCTVFFNSKSLPNENTCTEVKNWDELYKYLEDVFRFNNGKEEV